MRLRAASPEDADLLVRCIDMASEGLLPMIWAGYAPEGVDPMEVGKAAVLAEDGQFSHKVSYVIEADGAALGAMIAFRLPEVAPPPDPDVPEVFRAVEALEAEASGDWFINVIAVLPEARGLGLGAAMIAEAETQARAAGAPGLALIVAASNAGAVRFYQREGFGPSGRQPFDAREFGGEATEAILMVKVV